jgi:hypothetical protein
MWPIVLDAVGIKLDGQALPTTATCPICGDMVTVDLDTAHRGYWLSCGPCAFQGNLVEFGARLWKCDTDQAYFRLGQALPVGVDRWVTRQHLDSTQRMQTLHLFDDEATSTLLFDDGMLRVAIARRGLDVHGPGAIEALANLVYAREPQAVREAVVERPSAADRKRVSRSHGILLMLPAWDRPGRAVGALTVRCATNEEIFLRMQPASDAGGLFFAQVLPPKDADFGITIFAKVDDLWKVARLHHEERRVWGRTDLPLAAVSTVMTSPRHGFHWEHRPLVLWSDKLNLAAVALAKRLEAKLAIVPFTGNDFTPRNWLRLVAKNALDWRQVFEEFVLTASPETTAEAVRELGLRAEDARRISRDWEVTARDRLLGPARNAIQCAKYLYEEHGGILLRTNKAGVVEVASDHRVRIDQIIRTPKGLFYRGRVTHPAGEVIFAEPDAKFMRNSDWIGANLVRAGVTPGNIPSARKWREVAHVVRRLAPPAVVDGARTMGWDATLRVFVFNDFQMRVNGKCEEWITPDWLGPGRPTIGLLPPGPLPPAGLRELLTGRPSLAYLIAAIVARIIAPVLGHKLPPLALVGDSSVRAARLAHLMGCSMPTDWHRRPPAALGWPCVLTGTRQQKRKGAKRLRKASANMVVAVTSMELRALSVRQPWQRLRCPARSLPPIPISGSEADQVLRKIIPAFLAHVCVRYRIGGLPRHRGGFIARIYKALAAWLYSQPGAEDIRAPQLRLHIGSDDPTLRATTCLAAMLRELVDNEDIRVVAQHADQPPQTAEVVLLPDGSCEVYIQAVAEIVRRRSAIPLARNRLRKALIDAKVITSWRRPETISAPDQPEVWTLLPGWWDANVAGPLAARTKQQPPKSTLKNCG